MDRIDKIFLVSSFVLLASQIVVNFVEMGWSSALGALASSLLGFSIGIQLWDWWKERK